MSYPRSDILLVRDAGIKDIAVIVNILSSGGVSSALWGVNAAVYYGGGLCPLDIELVINDADQERAFRLLTSRGILPAVPESATTRPTEFVYWRKLTQYYKYRDRRRTRLSTPIYELPRTGDEVNDAFLPFIILYSAESVGLPPVPSTSHFETCFSSGVQPYVPIHEVYSPVAVPGDLNEDWNCLIPKFAYLVESEMHVLLYHADFFSPVWGQHMAQLSELLRSRSYEYGLDRLTSFVNPRLSKFARWVQSDLAGEADYEDLRLLRGVYIHGPLDVPLVEN